MGFFLVYTSNWLYSGNLQLWDFSSIQAEGSAGNTEQGEERQGLWGLG